MITSLHIFYPFSIKICLSSSIFHHWLLSVQYTKGWMLILFNDVLQCCVAPSTSSLQLHLKGLLFWVQIFNTFSSSRYCAVCNPFAYAEHAKPDNVNRRVFKYFIIVIILSILINIPRFLETKIVTETVRSNDSGSVQDQTFISYDVTDLRYADLWGQD